MARRTTNMNSRSNVRMVIVQLMLLATCSAFTTSFTNQPQQALHLMSDRSQPQHRPSRGHRLFVVADPPNKGDEIRRGRRNNRDDDDDGRDGIEDGRDDNVTGEDGSWTASRGGFVPNIKRIRGIRLRREALEVGKRDRLVKPIEVLTIQQYKAIVVDEPDRMVCVKFYAPWCKACKAVEKSFRRLGKKYPDMKFVEVPLTKDNAFLHEGLGIPALPFGHLYHPDAGLVEEQRIRRKLFPEFERTLQSYVNGQCDVEYPDESSCNEEDEGRCDL